MRTTAALLACALLAPLAHAEEPLAVTRRRPLGFTAWGGFSCISVSRTAEGNGSCFALPRIGFEFGWGELHGGALLRGGDSGYNPFSGLDEGGSPAWGMQLGLEVGSPYMALSRRVRLAARGSIDHDLFWDGQGRFMTYAAVFGNNVAFAFAVGHGVSLTARAGVGLMLPFNLVVDGGVGVMLAR